MSAELTITFTEPECRLLAAIVMEGSDRADLTAEQVEVLSDVAGKFIEAANEFRRQLIDRHGVLGAAAIAEEIVSRAPNIEKIAWR